ncbi:MAG: hypothetical protein N3E37_02015 [Candidatus Micrarchaeota archaeon]|nr:hypothetical protein [Candidatus Micrarchaeota archaeon]
MIKKSLKGFISYTYLVAFFYAVGITVILWIIYSSIVEPLIKPPLLFTISLIIITYCISFLYVLNWANRLYEYGQKLFESLKGYRPETNPVDIVGGFSDSYYLEGNPEEIIRLVEFPDTAKVIFTDMVFKSVTNTKIKDLEIYYGGIIVQDRLTSQKKRRHLISDVILIKCKNILPHGYCIRKSDRISNFLSDSLLKRKEYFDIQVYNIKGVDYEICINKSSNQNSAHGHSTFFTLLNIVLSYTNYTNLFFFDNLLFIDVSYPKQETKNDPRHMINEIVSYTASL